MHVQYQTCARQCHVCAHTTIGVWLHLGGLGASTPGTSPPRTQPLTWGSLASLTVGAGALWNWRACFGSRVERPLAAAVCRDHVKGEVRVFETVDQWGDQHAGLEVLVSPVAVAGHQSAQQFCVAYRVTKATPCLRHQACFSAQCCRKQLSSHTDL